MNVLIVEGKDDKAFIEYLLNLIGIKNVSVSEPPQTQIKELGGLSKEALKKQIASIIPNIRKDAIKKLGIIIDLDSVETHGGFENRLQLVNDSIKEAFEKYNYSEISELSNINQFVEMTKDNTKIEIACFFIHLNGKGELEDVLRKIKIPPSNHADCLESWRGCLKCCEEKIIKSDKEINKLWLHYYIRYDICTLAEQDNAGKYCNLNHVLNDRGNKLFKFEHECLNELKAFLKLFKNEAVISE